MATRNDATEANSVRASFAGLEAARTYAQAMRTLNYFTTITVESGVWMVTAIMREDAASSGANELRI